MLQKIDYTERDWKEDFTDEDYARLQTSVPIGVFFHVDIGSFVDSNMLVRGPKEMREWISNEENACLLFDVGDYASKFSWNGIEVVGLHRKEWRSLKNILDIESEEDESNAPN